MVPRDSTQIAAGLRRGRIECTLLELVRAVGDCAGSEREAVATLVQLVRSGRVRLIGALRDERIPAE